MFRFLILGLLRPGRPMHGYALMKAYRERSGANVSSGNFYRELQRLIRDGLARAISNPGEADSRRMPYEITEHGVAVFDGWFTTEEAAAGSFSEDDISTRALFVPDLGPTAVKEVLQHLRENLWLWSKRLEHDRQRALLRAKKASPQSVLVVFPLLCSRRLKHVAADLEFIDTLQAEYERWATAQRAESMLATAPATPTTKPVRKRNQAS